MRILYGHCYTPASHFGLDWIEAWLGRLRAAGIEVSPLQLGLDVPGRRLAFRELERRWLRGDRALMELYESVARAAEGADVLINAGALNLHPDFLDQLPLKTVLSFNDDPEASAASRPVAAHHDLCMVGNIAEVETYRSWGARAEWWPLGFRADDHDPSLTEEQIVSDLRTVDIALLCERLTSYRRRKVDQFALAFPQGEYHGPGWPRGFLPESDRIPLLKRTKIGINIHNSTGPINFRTYYLPANGVMQICDNKHYLAGVYRLNHEVVGYDDIKEAIDLCRYYLAHADERCEIALAGWRRALADYNEVTVFNRLVDSVQKLDLDRASDVDHLAPMLTNHLRSTRLRRASYRLTAPVTEPIREVSRLAKGLGRRFSRWIGNGLYRIRASRKGLPVSEKAASGFRSPTVRTPRSSERGTK